MTVVNILLIGDEPNILRILRRNLISRGYEVLIALDDQEAEYIITKTDISLFVLNLDFETIEIDGLAIVEMIRENSQAPLIVLSAIGSENLKIQALDMGAGDSSRDGRGIVYAQLGRTDEAIQEFEAYLAWLSGRPDAAYHLYHGTAVEQWLERLRAGENPFDQATLDNLRRPPLRSGEE